MNTSPPVAGEPLPSAPGPQRARASVAAWVTRARGLRMPPLPRGLRMLVSPGIVTALAYLPILVLYARLSKYTRVSDFITIGYPHGHAAGVDNLVQGRSTYDAQFAYFMARFPGQNAPHVYDDAVIRWTRMLQPLLVRIVSLGHISLMPWAFLALNVAAAAIGTAILGRLLPQVGVSRWIALAFGLYAGIQAAIFRDVGDPIAIMWVIVALWGLLRQSPLQTAAALGFAALSRETMLIFVPLLFLPLLVQRRWLMLLWSALIALVPFSIWQIALKLWLGKWGLIESLSSNHSDHFPFSALLFAVRAPQFGIIVIFVVVPILLIWVVAVADILERGVRAALLQPFALTALVFTLALSFQDPAHWLDLWAAGRLFAPALPFALLLAPRSVTRVQSSLIAILLLSGCIVAFGVMWG